MRRFLLCLLVAGSALSGCHGQKQPPDAETKLFRDFSLDELAERVKPPQLKLPSSGVGSSASQTRRRRDFNLTYLIDEVEGAKLDEADFMTRIKVEAESVIAGAGVSRHGGGTSGDGFHFDYYDEDHEGWVEVKGTRMEGNHYKLWGVIREQTKNAKE
jgi:hypothetical protein